MLLAYRVWPLFWLCLKWQVCMKVCTLVINFPTLSLSLSLSPGWMGSVRLWEGGDWVGRAGRGRAEGTATANEASVGQSILKLHRVSIYSLFQLLGHRGVLFEHPKRPPKKINPSVGGAVTTPDILMDPAVTLWLHVKHANQNPFVLPNVCVFFKYPGVMFLLSAYIPFYMFLHLSTASNDTIQNKDSDSVSQQWKGKTCSDKIPIRVKKNIN